jgi:hypothetical protein
MGDIAFSMALNNLVALIFYCNLQLIHNFLKKLTWFPPPTHSYKFLFKYPKKTGWKGCKLAVPNKNCNDKRNFSTDLIFRWDRPIGYQSETIQTEH